MAAGVLLAVAAFLLYAGTVLVLPQVRDARYCCEQSSFAAATSSIIYRTRVGSFFDNVFDFFVRRLNQPLGQALAELGPRGQGLWLEPPGSYVPATRDGNGVGYPLVATAAFRLLGLEAWAVQAVMLGLMALSAWLYLWRFAGACAAPVVLYFAALTVMLFTPLVWDPAHAIQIAVGGIRYFSLVCVLPLFHILLSLLEAQPERALSLRRDAVLLALQALILALGILVRGSALSLVGAILLVAALAAWRRRRARASVRPVVLRLAVMALAAAALLAAIVATVPRQYLTEGRLGTVFWQRVTESIGANPAWPFPGASDLFDCPEVASGLESGMSDNNGGCFWFDYVRRHGIARDTLHEKTFGRQYEAALRAAFFTIARRYPAEVLAAFVYYKPRMVAASLAASLRLNLAGDSARLLVPDGVPAQPYPAAAIGFAIAMLGVVLAFFARIQMTGAELKSLGFVVLVSALFTLPAYFAAWAMPHTAADLLLLVLLGAGLALGAAIVGARNVLAASAVSQQC